jgi:outer membrane cobalamin receptor
LVGASAGAAHAAAPAAAAALAAAADASVAGTVLSTDGAPVAGAVVSLSGDGATLTAKTNADGVFAFATIAPGTYALAVTAPGYNSIASRTVQIGGNAKTTIDLRLPRQQASSLITIGSVRTNGAQAISSLPAPTLDISTQPYAQQGVTRVSDILGEQLSTTVVPIIGGGLNAPAVVSLRGPDPSETLVDVDGHQVNNGSTGDFDLSLLDPADLTSAQVVYGIAPSSLFGPNTLGGALNVRTLEPTAQQHSLERFTMGTFGTMGETLQATGTVNDRLGYAFSFHRLTSAGDQDGTAYPTGAGPATIGDSLDTSSTIAKLRYSLYNGAGFVGVSLRDQSVYRDVSSTYSSVDNTQGAPIYSNYSGSSVLSHNAAYDLDLQLPLGTRNAAGIYETTALYRHQTSITDQTVNGGAADTSPYLYNDRDIIGDDTLEIDHTLPRGTLSLRYALTNEQLTTDFLPGVVYADSIARSNAPQALSLANDVASFSSVRSLDDDDSGSPSTGVSSQYLSQVERSLGIRYAADPTSHLHYTFAGYYSDYSTFGHSIDPRFGFVWTPQAASAIRFSIGSTFQSPQLPTFIVPPTLPTPVDGYVSIGNPSATAERATSLDLGYEHRFTVAGREVHFGGDVYRTNLHNGVATYVPTNTCEPDASSPTGYSNDGGTLATTSCLTYPVNTTQEVYQGVELRGDVSLAHHNTVHLGYDIDSVYTKGVPASSLDDVVIDEQSLGVPLHKATIEFAHDPGLGLAYNAALLYEGAYNETNLGAYATLQAGATMHMKHFDISLNGTNLTDVYDFKQTRVGAGVPYGTASGGAAPTDAIPLAPRTVTLSIAHRM